MMERLTRSAKYLLVALIMGIGCVRDTHAEFMIPPTQNVPIDRLITNVQLKVVSEPRDPQWHYTLARLHSMVAAGIQMGQALTQAGKNLPDFPYFITYGGDWSWKPQTSSSTNSSADAEAHFRKAIAEYDEAIRLQNDHLYAWMGKAWCAEQLKDKPLALEVYRKAHDLAWVKESKSDSLYVGSSITVESGNALLRLLEVDAVAERKRVSDHVKAINKKPMYITPIILPVADGISLGEMIGRDRPELPTAIFDTVGDGQRARWEWITDRAAFIVLDPQRTGVVKSGRQFFGSTTWWVFWQDGYQALSALDDNNDGELTGEELAGMSIWQDTNGNGVSETGEVKPVADWGIVGISCRAIGILRDIPWNSSGIVFRNGTVRPTYDWRPRRIEPRIHANPPE